MPISDAEKKAETSTKKHKIKTSVDNGKNTRLRKFI